MGLAARQGAFRLLSAVLWRGQPLEDALAWAFQGINDPRDRALARAITSATLRWKTDLDAALDRLTTKPLPDDSRARLVITAAFAQLAVLKLPAHAVIATTLELLEAGPRRLAHAVLSRAARGALDLPERPSPPPVLLYNWQQTYPADVVEGLQDALAATPPLDLRLRDPAMTQVWAERLGGVSLMPGHLRLIAPGRIEALEGFAEGQWWVQDLAAQLPALLLRAKAGDAVLDVCAAPGGKTMQLASLGARVTALDMAAKRLERLAANLERTGLAAATVAADALTYTPVAPFTHILVDAPCSATGTYRRHPDVLWARASGSPAPTRAIQAALLRRACDWLAPGGTLVYAVCALEPEEGEAQISALIAERADIALVPVTASEAGPAVVGLAPEGWLRLRPDMLADVGRIDGFFIARLTRRS